ncbi:hypothetical protein [Paenibacillus alvei]|uniref:hypothetical protein n=1 Tax=Paenibacillus alvei TaxID=44250 RepID=UPI002282EBDB|nr:hypothetical protein [Paenibacillus alvei]
MRGKIGSFLKFCGGFLIFALVLSILGMLMDRSMFRKDYLMVCLLVFLLPGLVLRKIGGSMKKKADEREQLRQLGLNPPSMAFQSFLRFAGGFLMFLYGIVWFGMIVNWSTQGDKFMLAAIFALLFFTPGVLLWWAASGLEKRSQERFRREHLAYFEQETVPMPSYAPTIEEIVEEPPAQPIRRAEMEAAASSTVPQTAPQLPKMIACSSCGAQTSVSPSSTSTCEYCGSTVTYR